MAIAMKGIFKGFKIIAQIFTMHKEHEMEIGYPTDVRHVSHIGLGASDSCPSWMNEFRGLAEASAGGPVSSVAQSRQTSWASLDFEQPIGVLLPTEACPDSSGHDAACGGTPRGPKKATRTKKARASSPASSARSPSWRSMASFATACDDNGEPPSALRVA
ncbi:CRIB domain-containing protein RIC10-like isoform X1 [Phragmites australis]|uniref:CRIB domain-containing protein RIC10-like isoform X1 n=1 Tax=Phragmites australis TaxID=29695 RepID=UPI002D77498E|nr:CRIB domain-containing protein RIC10-like isoform X1 [Phragmites australis]XP_062229594.1 CRIB domain-containing protein RIC10-like isoform X1 [Phragmites australis]XP_062229595.1 CRIB domain-containing protein RIC10-like isoform X1 [Phragmites australis]